MIAFLTYGQAPRENVPPGMPGGVPWRKRTCTETEAASLRNQGWQVLSDEDYDIYVDSLSGDLAAYEIAKVQLGIEGVVTAATQFGQGLMISFAAENVMLGITQDGKSGEILTKLQGILAAVQSGSLYEVITRVRSIPVEDYDIKYITHDRLLAFIHRIEDYLGLPRSTEL